MTATVLAFAGSTRKESFNRKLLAVAVEDIRKAGLTVTVLDLNDYPLPLYDGDLEAAEGLPENARKLKQLFESHQALLIASPEYNGSLTALLKNTLDWVSRPGEKGEAAYHSTRGKLAGIISASPSGFGGIRALPSVRHVLQALQITVLPDQITLSNAHKAFDEAGQLTDANVKGGLEKLAQHLVAAV